MNRTTIFLGVAGVLALIALVVGLPQVRGRVTTTTSPLVTTVEPQTSSDGSLTMTARLSHPYVNTGTSDVFVTVDVEAVEVPGATRSPVNLALVIDRSGSMSGFKLNQAKQAARQLISQLQRHDRLAIVHYGSDVKQLTSLEATPENKDRMLAYVDGIWDDGGTNIGAGLMTARDLLLTTRSDYKVNRLILISDGQPTEGITEDEGLRAIVRETRNFGISTSSIGVGDDFNEELMESFSTLGAGAYAYLQDASQLSAIFQKDLNAAGTQVAKGVTLTFRAPQGAHLSQVLGYQPILENQQGNTQLFTVQLPDFAAGQHERVVAHFRVNGAGVGKSIDVSALALEYSDLLKDQAVKSTAQLAALVTDKPEVVADNRDKDAIVFAARARSAENTQAAAKALLQGDKAEAKRLMQQNSFFFEEAAEVAGAPAVAADQQEQQMLLDGIESADDEADYKSFSKGARKKARIDFGQMDSTY